MDHLLVGIYFHLYGKPSAGGSAGNRRIKGKERGEWIPSLSSTLTNRDHVNSAPEVSTCGSHPPEVELQGQRAN